MVLFGDGFFRLHSPTTVSLSCSDWCDLVNGNLTQNATTCNIVNLSTAERRAGSYSVNVQFLCHVNGADRLSCLRDGN